MFQGRSVRNQRSFAMRKNEPIAPLAPDLTPAQIEFHIARARQLRAEAMADLLARPRYLLRALKGRSSGFSSGAADHPTPRRLNGVAYGAGASSRN